MAKKKVNAVKRIKYVYKPLPPHTWEKHLSPQLGGVSKPFIIGTITVAAILLLSLFLLFQEEIVGKAFFAGQASIGLGGTAAQRTFVDNFGFNVPIRANLGSGKQTVALGFQINLPAGLTCANFPAQPFGGNLVFSPSQSLAINENQCVNNVLRLRRATINAEEATAAGADLTLADLFFNANTPQGTYNLRLSNVEIIDFSNHRDLRISDVEGTPIIVEGDFDSDGSPDSIDNCPNRANTGQEDVDRDGFGDACDNLPNGIACRTDGQCASGFCPAGVCQIVNVCGNTQVDAGEDCDGSNLNGATCLTRGLPAGTLNCNACRFDTSRCSGVQDQDSDGVNSDTDCDDNNAAVRACVAPQECINRVCVLDTDNDGIADNADNCPNAANPGQQDADQDGVGDECEVTLSQYACETVIGDTTNPEPGNAQDPLVKGATVLRDRAGRVTRSVADSCDSASVLTDYYCRTAGGQYGSDIDALRDLIRFTDTDCSTLGAGYRCQQGICISPQCGNSFTDAGEQCDDGNTNNNDGCTVSCRLDADLDGVGNADDRCPATPSQPGQTIGADGCILSRDDDGDLVIHDLDCNDNNVAIGQCPSGQQCVNGACQTQQPQDACTTDAQCTTGNLRFCNTAANPNACVQCLINTDCGSGQICTDYACVSSGVQTCTAAQREAVCSAWSACQNSQQTRTCSAPAATVCTGGTALVLTQSCSAGQAADTTFRTTITAGQAVPSLVAYTFLFDNENVLVASKRELTGPLAAGGTYTSIIDYPFSNSIRRKEILVQDKNANSGRAVFADLTVPYTLTNNILAVSQNAVTTKAGTKITLNSVR